MDLSPDDMDTYSYLEGKSQVLKVSGTKQGEFYYATMGLGYNQYDYEDTDSVTSSYASPQLALTLGFYYSDFDLTTYCSFEQKEYATDSSGEKREDDSTTLSLQAGYSAHKYLRLFAEYSQSNNSSSDSDNNYDQNTTLVGLSSGF